MGQSYRRTIEVRLKDYSLGLIDSLDDFTIPPNAFSGILNWIEVKGSKELSRGTALKGTVNDSPPAGQSLKITGLHVAKLKNGTEKLWRKDGRRLMYFDESLGTPDWVEINTPNLFPDSAKNEDVKFTNAEIEVGTQVIFGSPNSGLWRMHAANPKDVVNMYDVSKNYKGWPIFLSTSTFVINFRDGGMNVSDFRRSRITATTNYTAVVSENLASGDGVTTTFIGTLAFKAGNPLAICFGINITDGTEAFTDDGCGNLVGNLGGTGTINYTTGAYSVTFNTAPIVGVSNITSSLAGSNGYHHENSNNKGITDFTFASPTRAALEGLYVKQQQGGPLLSIKQFGSFFYCYHRDHVTYRFSINGADDDTSIVNLPYFLNVGIPTDRAVTGTGEGMFYADVRDQDDPQFRVARLAGNSSELVPASISKHWKLANTYEGLDLSDYRFDDCSSEFWGKFVVFACNYKDSIANDTVFLYRKDGTSWVKRDFKVRMFVIYNGALVGGSSISQNVYTLFSGFDDEGNLIPNFVESSRYNLNYGEESKKMERWLVRGSIQDNARIKVYMAFDGGDYAFIGNIDWDGTYVDRTSKVVIGTQTIGSNEIGGSADQFAYPFRTYLYVGSPYFDEVKVKYIAIVKPVTGQSEDTSGGGPYVSITEEGPKGLRRTGRKLQAKFVTTIN